MLILILSQGDSPSYSLTHCLRSSHRLSLDQLRAGLQMILATHEAIRDFQLAFDEKSWTPGPKAKTLNLRQVLLSQRKSLLLPSMDLNSPLIENRLLLNHLRLARIYSMDLIRN